MFHPVSPTAALVLAVAACALSGARAEVTDSAPDGFSLRHTVEVDASAAGVYRALTKQVGKWWHPDHTFTGDAGNLRIEARGGGCFCEKLDDGGEVQHLQVVYAEPGKLLRMSGGLGPLQQVAVAGSLAFTLTESEGSTQVELMYTVAGYRPGGLADWAGPVDGVLGVQMRRLERYLETGAPSD
jgi:uncharacterized protein YndB with AHSA1/START domain